MNSLSVSTVILGLVLFVHALAASNSTETENGKKSCKEQQLTKELPFSLIRSTA